MWVAAHIHLMENDLTILGLTYKDAESAKEAVDGITKDSNCFAEWNFNALTKHWEKSCTEWRQNGFNGQWEKSCKEEIFVVRRVKIGA